MENGFFTVYNKSMASIMAALIANYIFSTLCQQVDDLALSFVTPLGAQYDNVLTHFKIHSVA
ncbi:hypothetical protein BML2537_04600 [Providencia stuartii]|nr:hypothetical protein BML2537_04600 [Providencia stuartii]GHB98709.1 hypothetical protein GCM10007290_28280 [Providencia thailandensis]